MGINWTYPYFSGAANFNEFFVWQISISDYDNLNSSVANTSLLDQYLNYKHQRTDDLVETNVNNYGYVLVALISQKLFPFVGDLQGIIWLQMATHFFISLFFVLFVLYKPIQRLFFIFFYAANPLIIYFTTFPFYYFWMFIPSFIFAIFILKPNWRIWCLLLSPPLLLFSLMIRPTTLFLSLFIFLTGLVLLKKKEKYVVVIAMIFLIIGIFFISSKSNTAPWHTMYVGLGAYTNDVDVRLLSDDEGYRFYYNTTGVYLNTNAVRGNYIDLATRELYFNALKNRYIEIFSKEPLLLIKNATSNFFQIFSVGYIVDNRLLTNISTGFGFMVLFFLLYTRQYIWILAIIASAISFFWYFPPIPAYNFAAYFLLVMGFMGGIEKINVFRFELESAKKNNHKL